MKKLKKDFVRDEFAASVYNGNGLGIYHPASPAASLNDPYMRMQWAVFELAAREASAFRPWNPAGFCKHRDGWAAAIFSALIRICRRRRRRRRCRRIHTHIYTHALSDVVLLFALFRFYLGHRRKSYEEDVKNICIYILGLTCVVYFQYVARYDDGDK